MTKKEFMLQVIEFLPDWKMGRGLKPLIENDQLSPDVFEKLYQIFRENIHQTYTEIQKFQLKERLEKLEEMRQADEKARQEELVSLEAVFDDL